MTRIEWPGGDARVTATRREVNLQVRVFGPYGAIDAVAHLPIAAAEQLHAQLGAALQELKEQEDD